jgi:hypothetical protein
MTEHTAIADFILENNMAAKVTRTYSLKLNDGQTIILSEEEAQTLQVAGTGIDVTCDSPRCARRHETDKPTNRAWTLEDAQTNPDKVPDDANRFIPVDNGKWVCSKQCLKDYAEYAYVCPPSPKELRAQMEAAKEKQAEDLRNLNPHLKSPEDSIMPVSVMPVQNRTTPDDDKTCPATTNGPGYCTCPRVAMSAVEVPALCQQEIDGYGHGV